MAATAVARDGSGGGVEGATSAVNSLLGVTAESLRDDLVSR